MVRSINEIGQAMGIKTIAEFVENSETRSILETLGVDYAQTVSCYAADDEGRACGRCDACAFRRRGFEEAGLPDPDYIIGGVGTEIFDTESDELIPEYHDSFGGHWDLDAIEVIMESRDHRAS